MKLLMVTRKVDKNDAQAGFSYGWVSKLAQKTEEIKVICLEKGNLNGLSQNVEVFSMGKEKGKSRLKELLNFQKGVVRFIRKVDGVFCHQNPEYTILIGPWAKIFGKKIVSWYSHRAINWRMKLMAFFADKVVTPTEEGFGLKSKKKIVVGHGIDTGLFKPAEQKQKKDILRIISVGRISPIKDYETLIKAIVIIKENIPVKIQIIGGLGLKEQKNYFEQLKEMVKKNKSGEMIEFKGLIPNQELPKYYQKSDISVNLCPTGSPDKVVLEAMACELPTLACNKTFVSDFGPYTDQLLFREKDHQDLAQKIISLAQTNQLEKIGRYLRKRVVKYHNLDKLMDKIVNVFEKIT